MAYGVTMTRHRRGSLTSRLFIVAAAAVSLLLVGGVPSQATPVVGTGLIRMDGTWATVKTLPSGSTVLTLNKEASGQWMGEVGQSRVPVVRDIKDKHLVDIWHKVGHASGVGVDATLTWGSAGNFELVTVSDPSITPRGHLRFVVEADPELPARMENISVNITRSDAPKLRAYPMSISFPLTANVDADTRLQFAYVAEVSLLNVGDNCYEYTLTQSAPYGVFPSTISCTDSLTFTSTTSTMLLPTPTAMGQVFFSSTMSASGSPFVYSGVIAQWAETGS